MNADQPGDPRHRLGAFLRDGDRIGLRYERHLRHPPERVWRALTESDSLQHWLPCDIVGPRQAGAAIELPFWPAVVDTYHIDQPVHPGRILTWDPPRVFAWQWDRDTLRFELQPDGEGTRLVFTTWLEDLSAGPASTAAGYHVCLDQLVALVDHGIAPPFTEADPSAYEVAYAAIAPEVG